MMRDNVGTLQFHSYSTYRHAMVLIVRAWIGDILLGYRRLFLLVSVKRAIGLLSVWDACVSQRLVPAAIFTSSLSVSFSSRARNLYSQPCTSHLSPSPPPSLATTSSIPLFFPHFFLPKTHSPTLLLALSRRLHIQPTMQGRARAWTSFLFFCFNSTLFGPVIAPHISTSFC